MKDPDAVIWHYQGLKGITHIRSSNARIKISLETVLVYLTERKTQYDFSTLLTITPEASYPEHPNAKPVGPIMRLIAETGANSVIDPCCGTGTTLVAAKQSRICGLGIELNPNYSALIQERLRQAVLPLPEPQQDPLFGEEQPCLPQRS
jgi:DNA modification methylase